MLKLTRELREELKKPFGAVLKGRAALERIKEWEGVLVAIGDACLLFLLEHGIEPDVAIYDFRIMRKEIDEKSKNLIREKCKNPVVVQNPAGFISDELRNAVFGALKRKKGNVFVDGEEDLSALVGIEGACRDSLLIYGQPRKGIVFVEITEDAKEKARLIMEKMEKV